MTTEITVELPWHTLDAIVVEELQKIRGMFEHDLQKMTEYNLTRSVYKDTTEVEKMLDACDLLISYYKGESTNT